jgi:hypothetical protein
MLDRRKKLIFMLVVVGAALFLALFAAEVFIRVTQDYVTPKIIAERSLHFDGARFARHALAREEFVWYLNRKEGIRGAVINDKGYRGPAFPAHKAEGTVRIMIYGGSAVFDMKAPENKDWPRQVEGLLRERGYPVEVINAGVPGHASSDSVGRLFAEGHLFEPDVVVLYNAWNDIRTFRSDEPLLRQAPESRFDPRVSYTGWLDEALCNTSQLYVRLRGRYFNAKYNIGVEGARGYGELGDDISDVALRQYRLNLQLFVDTARNTGAIPVLMTQGRLVAPDNDEAARSRIGYDLPKLTHEGLVRAYEDTDRITREVAESKDAPLIEASVLAGRADLFYDHVHTTPEGSAELARLTADGLEPVVNTVLAGAAPGAGHQAGAAPARPARGDG